MELHFALYHSRACIPDDPHAHNEILQACQRNNAKSGISGFLHREGDFFVQYLEGPKTKLHETLAKIGRDTRHTNFQIVQNGPSTGRMLPDWRMGFVDANQLSLGDLLEVSNEQLNIQAIDPFDLVVFMVHNAQSMQSHIAT